MASRRVCNLLSLETKKVDRVRIKFWCTKGNYIFYHQKFKNRIGRGFLLILFFLNNPWFTLNYIYVDSCKLAIDEKWISKIIELIQKKAFRKSWFYSRTDSVGVKICCDSKNAYPKKSLIRRVVCLLSCSNRSSGVLGGTFFSSAEAKAIKRALVNFIFIKCFLLKFFRLADFYRTTYQLFGALWIFKIYGD